MKREERVLAEREGKSPLILYRHGRWHLLTVGYVRGPGRRLKKGIASLHFMSRRRAEQTIAEWLAGCELCPFEDVLPSFRQEVAAKVLPAAGDYRPLLERGEAQLVFGHTTDTFRFLVQRDKSLADETVECLLSQIARWMRDGPMGPYLRFL